jgi:hypothetical protein
MQQLLKTINSKREQKILVILKNYQIQQDKERKNLINLMMTLFKLKSLLLVLIYLIQYLSMKIIKQNILIIKEN